MHMRTECVFNDKTISSLLFRILNAHYTLVNKYEYVVTLCSSLRLIQIYYSFDTNEFKFLKKHGITKFAQFNASYGNDLVNTGYYYFWSAQQITGARSVTFTKVNKMFCIHNLDESHMNLQISYKEQ